jgi:hypothetical protein
LKRPSLKPLASLSLALPERATDSICCVMMSVVTGMLVHWSLECRRRHKKRKFLLSDLMVRAGDYS